MGGCIDGWKYGKWTGEVIQVDGSMVGWIEGKQVTEEVEWVDKAELACSEE